MPFTENARLLSDYGLTRNQAIVYLAAVRLGTALISEISQVSGVRREDVYRSMARLKEMGLLELLPTKPLKLRAVPLEQAVSLLIERQRHEADRKISELTARKDRVLKSIRSHVVKVKLKEKPEEEFALLSNKVEVLNKVERMIEDAQREINMVTSAKEFAANLSSFNELVQKTKQKRIKIRTILELDPRHDSRVHRIKEPTFPRGLIDLRYTQKPLGHYFIVDFKQVLMATCPEPPLGQRPYLWTCEGRFVETMCRSFEETWHACVNDKSV